MWQERGMRRPPLPIGPSPFIHQPSNAPSRFSRKPFGHSSVPQRQVLIMKYTLDIYQVDPSGRSAESIFRDLDPDAFFKHSEIGRYSLTLSTMPWEYRSPAKRFMTLAFGPIMNHPYMQPNALRYVFCAINRTRNGKRIFLELPADLCLSVQVYQVLVTIQVKDCIGPLYGHIKQIIKDRPLTRIELDIMQDCLEVSCPYLYWFAVNIQEEREVQNMWQELSVNEENDDTVIQEDVDDGPDTSPDTRTGADGGTKVIFGYSAKAKPDLSGCGTNTESSEKGDGVAVTSDGEEQGYSADDCIPIARVKRARRSSEPAPYLRRMHDEPSIGAVAFRKDDSDDLEW